MKQDDTVVVLRETQERYSRLPACFRWLCLLAQLLAGITDPVEPVPLLTSYAKGDRTGQVPWSLGASRLILYGTVGME